MSVTLPTEDQLRAVAGSMGLSLSGTEIEAFLELMAPAIEAYKWVENAPDGFPPIRYPRTPGYEPLPDDNPCNAWYVKTEIPGAPTGKLQGKRVVLKDNVMLADVPMMNGSATLKGYTPEVDATVVTRILDAGGTIAGKAMCEAFCVSSGSHTSASGPVHNPYRTGYCAGGSSSGCAVLVARGEVDMAIGTDQAGSIRVPSALCGTCGMKPTYGLAPYTGILSIEPYLDHVGPITATVRDNALLLEVLAGPDGIDFRQAAPPAQPYTELLDGGIKNMKIAIVREGFALEGSDPEINTKVLEAAAVFAKLGASVEEISIPDHAKGLLIFIPLGVSGLVETMMWGDGYGMGHSDMYVPSFMDFHHDWRRRAMDLPVTVQVYTLLGTYINRYYGRKFYGKAVNLAKQLRSAYDRVLDSFDLLLMPTTPHKARPLPTAHASREESFRRSLDLAVNTLPFDVTHHPAMNVPCGRVDGLPIGMMLVGRLFDEPTIYRAAYAFEQSVDWRER